MKRFLFTFVILMFVFTLGYFGGKYHGLAMAEKQTTPPQEMQDSLGHWMHHIWIKKHPQDTALPKRCIEWHKVNGQWCAFILCHSRLEPEDTIQTEHR